MIKKTSKHFKNSFINKSKIVLKEQLETPNQSNTLDARINQKRMSHPAFLQTKLGNPKKGIFSPSCISPLSNAHPKSPLAKYYCFYYTSIIDMLLILLEKTL